MSSGQNHHKYFIKKLKEKKFKFTYIFFDKKKFSSPFATGITDKKKQDYFEKKIIKNFVIDPKPKYIYDLNSAHVMTEIKKIKPDLGVVFGTRKLSKELINIFKDGLVNIHRGYIQKYRGLDSDYWTLYHKDYSNLGVTLHYVDENLDTGNIIDQKFLKIDKKFKIFQLRYLTTELSVNILKDFLKKYISKKKISSLKQKKIGQYYSFMPKVLMKQIEKKFN